MYGYTEEQFKQFDDEERILIIKNYLKSAIATDKQTKAAEKFLKDHPKK